MANIRPLRQVGSLQNVFMFNVYLEFPSILGLPNTDTDIMKYLMISTSIPKYTREMDVVRYNNQEVIQPGGKTTEHRWSTKIRMTRGGKEYDNIMKWFYNVDKYDVLEIQGNARIELLANMAGEETEDRVTKKFLASGIWPLDYPEITDLNQDEKTGLIELDVEWGFDSFEPRLLGTNTPFKVAGY